jgi:hypothetical protein
VTFGTEYTEYQKVFVVIKKISDLLNGYHFGGLSTVTGWAVLFRVLCHNRNIDLKDVSLSPRNFNDLVYKVKLLLNGASRLRFGFGEGQKRTYSSLYFCLGLLPDDNLDFHGYAEKASEYQLESAEYTGCSTLAPDMLTKINKKLRKLSTSINVLLIQVQAKEPGFFPHVVLAIQQLSARSAKANNETQVRGWRSVIISLCQNLSQEIFVPYECISDKKIRKERKAEDEDSDSKWMAIYRGTIAKHFWDSRTLQDVRNAMTCASWFSTIDNKNDFEKRLFDIKKTTCLNKYNLNIRQKVGAPRLIYILIYLITAAATDDPEMEELSRLVISNGKPSRGKVFIPAVEKNTSHSDFPEIEVQVC